MRPETFGTHKNGSRDELKTPSLPHTHETRENAPNAKCISLQASMDKSVTNASKYMP